MALIQLPAAQHMTLPWKNGLGMSQVIASDPPGAGFDTLRWQVGSTQIGADCPFSDLPGLDRLFMVIGGDGVELTCVDEDGKTRRARIEPMQPPYAFKGDWRTDCRLIAGPVTVLNVITRPGQGRASVELAHAKFLTAAKDETVVAVDLDSLDAWLLYGATECFALPDATARVTVVRIHPVTP
jgi:environmental stress-induced protein Ves